MIMLQDQRLWTLTIGGHPHTYKRDMNVAPRKWLFVTWSCLPAKLGIRDRRSAVAWQDLSSRVDRRRTVLDTRMGWHARPISNPTLVHNPGRPPTVAQSPWDVTAHTVSNLCGKGQLSDAVDALTVLVGTESRVSTSLLYSVLKRCVAEKNLAVGRRVHDLIVKVGYDSNAFLGNHILRMYACQGRLEEAMDVFTRMAKPDVFMWFSIISAHAKRGKPKRAIQLYHEMCCSGVKPNGHVFVAALQACAIASDLRSGRQVHSDVLGSRVPLTTFVCNSLVHMYAKCGELEDARSIFESLDTRDVVTWNAMISGYAENGLGQEGLALYARMEHEGMILADRVTFVCLLQACASVGLTAVSQGRRLHAEIEERGLIETDAVVGNSLVNMYAKCWSLVDARRVFERLSHKDVVTWNVMIAGYSQQGLGQEALSLYSSMQQEGLTPPDAVTFVCLLQACARVAALHKGKQLHAQVKERGLQNNLTVGNSLVNMYAKCGSIDEAQQVFDSLPKRDVVAWSALIAGYTLQGDSGTVFHLVNSMRDHGLQLNDVTFLSVLTACSHAGLVNKGREYFEAMSTDYGITPTVEHYTCMIDLLGRAGQVEEALVMVKTMPFEPNGSVLRTLLSACRKWRNVEVAKQVFVEAVKLNEKDSSAYMVSNIFASAQMWEQAKELQARRKQCGGMEGARAELVD